MEKPPNPSPLRLSAFIQLRRPEIIAEWISFARTLHPWSKELENHELQDHAGELLTAIVADIETAQTLREQTAKSKGLDAGVGALGGVGKKHAIDRLESGLKLDQLVSEYRALRASVLRLWEKEHGDGELQITRFNEAIDESLAESAAWYSKKLTQTREQFLGILGHDLRNPLSSILMGATVLTQSETMDVKEVGVATRILNSGRRMNRMVADLLDLTRTRLGSSIPVQTAAIDLRDVCEDVVAELRAAHPDCKIELETRGDLQLPGDSDRLSQVLSNLVSNGVQYGESGVRVTASGTETDVVVAVHNSGEPIAPTAIRTVFDFMVRAPVQNPGKNATGVGLGLFIAREIVVAHGGTIGVTSTRQAGTTFTVTLPRVEPKPQPVGEETSRLALERASAPPPEGGRATARARKTATATSSKTTPKPKTQTKPKTKTKTAKKKKNATLTKKKKKPAKKR